MHETIAHAPDGPEAQLLERSRAVLRERFGTDDWRIDDRHAARKARLLLLHCPLLGKRAVLKCYRDRAALCQQAAAHRQLEPLCAVAPRGFGIPALYADFSDAHALLLEWVEARELEQALVRAALRPGLHRAQVQRAAAWLRWFHDLNGVDERPYQAARHARQLSARLAAAPVAAGRFRDDPLWTAALRRFNVGLHRLDGIPVPSALAHGDFTSTNLLVSGTRVVGIDLWAEHRLPIAEDLARMFVYLAAGDVLPAGARLRPVPLPAWRAQQALLAGYASERLRDDALWRHLVLYETLARRLALGERLARRGNFVEQWKCGGLQALLHSLLGAPTTV
jgi:hypothetical protein